MHRLILFATLLSLGVFSSCANAQDMTPTTVDIVEVASASGQFETLLEAVMAADLAEALATEEEITVFAPINEAFQGVEDLDALLADQAQLASVLKLHVVPSQYLSDDLTDGETEIETLNGEKLTITRRQGQVSITSPSGVEAMVVRADIKADNGVIHAINKVLIP